MPQMPRRRPCETCGRVTRTYKKYCSLSCSSLAMSKVNKKSGDKMNEKIKLDIPRHVTYEDIFLSPLKYDERAEKVIDGDIWEEV